jgi:hypothetical protein
MHKIFAGLTESATSPVNPETNPVNPVLGLLLFASQGFYKANIQVARKLTKDFLFVFSSCGFVGKAFP